LLSVDDSTDPAKNLSREDDLFKRVDSGELPEVVRFWVNAQCLVRGKVKHPKYGWYNEELTARLGIPVHQRSTGGGVVYQDEGNLNWSFFLRTPGRFLSPTTGFETASQHVVAALESLGIAARFAAPNRIDVSGRKVSGMAARTTRRALLVHGTLLLSANLNRLNELCVPPAGCPPVANLADLAEGISKERLVSAVVNHLKETQFKVIVADGI
jgi:lipoate-protein ligase A